MSADAEAERLRDAAERAERESSVDHAAPAQASRVLLARTCDPPAGSYPTAAGVLYPLEPLGLLGTESAGSSGVKTATGAVFYALHIGATAPPVDTEVIAHDVPHRWVFRHD